MFEVEIELFNRTRSSLPLVRPSRPSPSWSALFLFGLATRVLVVTLGSLLARSERPSWLDNQFALAGRSMNVRHLAALSARPGHPIASWYRWDAIWYAEISEKGYRFERGQPSSVAFMPLLPLLMGGGAAIGLDRYRVGLLLPNLAFAAGLACFGHVVFHVTGNAGTVWRACILLVAYPWSFFFSAPYQESLSFALTSGAILAWLNYRPAQAAMISAWASAARLGAGAFSVAILLEWCDDVFHRRRARHPAWPVALAGAVGAGLFFVYLYWLSDDPLLHLRSHQAWGRASPSLSNVLRSFMRIFSGFRCLESSDDYYVMLLFICLGVRAWRVRGPFWGSLVLIPVIQGMATGSILSMTRIVLTAFPAFMDAAELLRSRGMFVAYVGICLIVQAVMIEQYVNWQFVG